MEKIRLDMRMVELGLAPSREKARAMILAGEVRVNGVPARKAGEEIRPEAAVEVLSDPVPFVSRGGLKLQKAVQVFSIDLKDKDCLDVGASTGGFTDCMLQQGARHVWAMDVGYGQLDWKLRQDSRVTVMERTNARYMEPGWFPGLFDFASIDVSFISLKLILPALKACLKEGGQVAALIKPQFEAGKGEVGKNGVVREAALHTQICAMIMQFAQDIGFWVRDLSFSPITGPKGNIEFLLYLENSGNESLTTLESFSLLAAQIVAQAHESCIKS